MFCIDDDVREQVAKMFGRTSKVLDEDVQIVKKWLQTQAHLPELMDEAKIRNFLIMNKCSIEKTKRKIDMYYTARSLIPELYDDSNPKLARMKNLMGKAYCCTHPVPVERMYRVTFIKIKEPNTYTPREMIMQCGNIFEIRLHEDCMIGEVIVMDMDNMTINDMTQLTLSLLMKTRIMYQEVYSLRMKALYFLNSPPYIANLMAIFKTKMKPKLFERVHVSQNSEVLKDLFATEDLPKDYGGKGPSLQQLNEMMQEKLLEYQKRFDELDKLRVDERLRPAKLNNDEILGFYGNFKKIDVD